MDERRAEEEHAERVAEVREDLVDDGAVDDSIAADKAVSSPRCSSSPPPAKDRPSDKARRPPQR